jgi:hypothetical protein
MPRRQLFAARTPAPKAATARVATKAAAKAATKAATTPSPSSVCALAPLLLFAALLAGCFSPRFESGQLSCGAGACPRGFYCAPLDGKCWREGEAPSPDGGTQLDGAELPPAQPPTVVQPAAATPSPVLGTSTALSVLGGDAAGEGGLTYTWSLSESTPGLVGYSDNGTNSAKNTTAIFTAAGRFTFQVVIQNRAQATAASTVDVEVQQRVNDLAIVPSMATVPLGGMKQFEAMAFDQFGAPLALPFAIVWLLTGNCGVISADGLFQAGAAMTGSCAVTATVGTVRTIATVSVGTPEPITRTPIADAYVEDGMGDKNFGGVPTLLIKTQTDTANNRISYLRFSLAGVIGPISGAKLRLFGRTNTATHMDSAFAVSDNAWTETAITWKNKPALGARVARVGVTTAPKYHEWDVGAFVQARLQAGDATVNLALQMDGSTNEAPDTFESRESPMNKPQLVLTQ